jgi:hypothetical protein
VSFGGSHGGVYEVAGFLRCLVSYICRRFRDAFCLILEAASTSETLISIKQTARRNNPEDGHLSALWSLTASEMVSYLLNLFWTNVTLKL